MDSSSIVLPGSLITSEQGYLRGHGSFINRNPIDGSTSVFSSVAGYVERINKLVSVKPVKSRYIGEIGDLVVGRIKNVESKRWKVNICGHRDANLQLSSVNLPGGVQRMRTYEDQLQMRTLFTENDLISAEIQNISSDGIVSLHTRSLKYGKLDNGQLIVVPSSLVRRLPQHYISLASGIDVILGKNGYIWITRAIPEEWKLQECDDDENITPLAETLQNLKQKHINTPISLDERLKIARVRNAIYALSRVFLPITPLSITSVYTKSEELGMDTKDMIIDSNIKILADNL